MQPAPLDPTAPAEAAARHFLNVYGKWFGISDPQQELKLLRSRESLDRGRSSVRFQQNYQNIPVLAGEIIVNFDAAKNVTSVSGKVLPDISLDLTAQVNISTAQTTALQAVAKWYQRPDSELEVSPAALWIYNPVLLMPSKGVTTLVWRMEVRSRDGVPSIRELVLVGAQRGDIVLHFNQVDTAKNLNTYTMNGSSNEAALPGALVCVYPSDLICALGDADARAAHIYAGDTYDFYLNTHGRDSIDGAGMPIISSVHFGVGLQNAFWNGQQMVYGDGFSAADDVVGHELTHGVTQYESGLFYYYQSGAINESFSDVWGEFVDLTNGKGNDTPAVRWLMGEDIPGIGAIRSMNNPPLYNNPDKMTGGFYYTGADDQGGVHTNSGVNNKAAYLMTDGGSFNGLTVAGLGITKVAKIYYEAQTNLLTSGSDYADLYDALRQACSNLVGTAGITSSDCAQVKNAIDAVEMNQQPVPGFNPEAPLCPAGQQVVSQPFFDNMEGSLAQWTTTTLAGTSNLWFRLSGYATSGVYSLAVSDIPATSDSVLTIANAIVVPAGAYLHFRHFFNFEYGGSSNYYDGGVVEYSTNNGATWTDLGPLWMDGKAYSGSLSTCCSNPLGGRSAFGGDSHGYVSSRYNLASLSGQSFRLRFRQGTDSSVGVMGWGVDDVRIYNCTSTSSSTTSLLAGVNSAGGIYYTTDLSTWHNIPGALSRLVAGDFDGDGKADDLAGVNSAGGIYYTTDLSTWHNIPGALSRLVAGDFDGDGKADDLAGVNSAGGIYYTTDLSTWHNIPGALSRLVAGDFNGDGKADLAGVNSAGGIYYTTNLSTW
ncbi:MAG: M4 family metallopeptidase, partial [Candidatus Competibacter sp.]